MKRKENIMEKIVNELHRQFAFCGHCGKPKCPDRSFSKLPLTIPTEKAISAIEVGLSVALKEKPEGKP